MTRNGCPRSSECAQSASTKVAGVVLFGSESCGTLPRMAGSHRLAALIQLRDKAEKDALDRLGAVVREVAAAAAALEDARSRALVDHRQATEAGLWVLAESDHRLALERVDRTGRQLREAQGRESNARLAHLKAYQEAEVVRRLAKAREGEARAAEEKRELKTLDEIASRRLSGRGPRR